jgi:hypothetical protein
VDGSRVAAFLAVPVATLYQWRYLGLGSVANRLASMGRFTTTGHAVLARGVGDAGPQLGLTR